jgi:hypothetical protein
MTYSTDRAPGETHLFASTPDNPERSHPTGHRLGCGCLSWVVLFDGLPRP